MRAKFVSVSVFALLAAGVCSAQTGSGPTQVGMATAYCSGFVTDQKVPDETRLISGAVERQNYFLSRGLCLH